MLVDINVKVTGNQVVLTGPQIRMKESTIGVMVIHKDTRGIIGLGETEESLKKTYIEALGNLSVKEMEKFDVSFSLEEKVDWKKAKELYEEVNNHSTEKVWNFIKENFVFHYPFNLSDLQPKYIMNFIHLYVDKIVIEQIRPGFLGEFISSYWDCYAFNLTLEGLETLDPQVVKEFETELVKCLKYGLFKVKALSVNGKKLV